MDEKIINRSFFHLTLFFFWLTIVLPAPAAAEGATAGIYARHKDSVAQIRILDRTSGSKAGIGSGFAVSAGGRLVTNYHVIAELVNRPQRYAAEYRMEDGHRGSLTLLGLDVVHDLAVLQAEEWPGTYLDLADRAPEKGERIFSFGTPLDLGFTIVEGTYNGLLEKSMYDKIHFTGSLNPGMSGGPTVNADGTVVGINVATAGNQVSFLVPVSFARILLAEPAQLAEDSEMLVRTVAAQMLDNQDRYVGALLASGFASFSMDGYTLPGELSHYVNCWSGSKEKDEQLFELTYQDCSSRDSIYLANNLRSGDIRFRHELFTTEELGEIRFYHFLEEHFQNVHLTENADESDFTNYKCESGFLSLRGIEAKTVFCARGYKKFAGLFDAYFSAITVGQPAEALHTTLLLTGVSFENARRFAESYAEAIRWNKKD